VAMMISYEIPLSIALLSVVLMTGSLQLSEIVQWQADHNMWLGLLMPLAPSFGALAGLRALQGVALAGVPAVAMAYLADEIHPSALAGAVGTFVAGNGLGGLAGRMLAAAATDLGGWRLGMAAVSALSVGCTVAFALLLPKQRHGVRAVGSGALRRHLADAMLRRLYVTGFVLMGGFVTVYNYLSYRLLRPPFELPPVLVGLIFLAYLVGTAASAAAGRLADRHGPRPVLVGAVLLAIGAAVAAQPGSEPAGEGSPHGGHGLVLAVGDVAECSGDVPDRAVTAG